MQIAALACDDGHFDITLHGDSKPFHFSDGSHNGAILMSFLAATGPYVPKCRGIYEKMQSKNAGAKKMQSKNAGAKKKQSKNAEQKCRDKKMQSKNAGARKGFA